MAPELDRAYLQRPADTAAIPRTTRPLAVLIVTYKSHDLLEKCLAHVVKHLPELPVYVYENSGDDYPGRHELAARHPYVNWVLGPVNLGFAAAFNALVKHTSPDTDLLALNPDARLLGPLTATRHLLCQPGVAAVSPLILGDGPGPQRWDVATRRRNLTRALVGSAGYADALRGTWFSFLYPRQPAEDDDVDGYLGGACLAINRDAWNAIGGFDEEFFLYGEETDWQTRARAAGWRIALADELGVDHCGEEGGHGPAVAPVERGRNYDLLRAHTALLLEHQYTVHHADVYLAATTLLDRVQRSRRQTRRRARRRSDLPHIVLTTNRLMDGGPERQKVLLAKELERRGYPVTVVCLQRLGPLIREIPHSVRVVRQPWWAPLVDGPAGSAVVISGDTNTETGFATLWRATGRGRRWLVASDVPPGHDRPSYSRPLAAAMRRADGFIALAHRHWEMLTETHRLGDRPFVAPNGAAIPAAPPPHRSPGQPLHLVMLSRVVERTNPHLLVEALAGLPEPPWRLSIFGDDPEYAELETRAPAGLRDRVNWRGRWPGPEPALSDADLLCVPGRSEESPLVILEAMARGVPVAASAICEVPEMLDHGRAGFVVEPVTVQRWREELGRILADPDALPEVGRRGFARMQARYTIEAMTDAYLDAIGSVL